MTPSTIVTVVSDQSAGTTLRRSARALIVAIVRIVAVATIIMGLRGPSTKLLLLG